MSQFMTDFFLKFLITIIIFLSLPHIFLSSTVQGVYPADLHLVHLVGLVNFGYYLRFDGNSIFKFVCNSGE